MLPVSDDHEIYWEASGNPNGKPLLYLHGGPGGGLKDGYRRRFDPEKYLIIGLDQRGCGRSRPLATPDTLAANTTQHLIADIEALRDHLGVQRWLVCGGSWGTTLALAYAQTYPERVTEMVLVATTTGTPDEVEWITETVGCLFPKEWDAFRKASHAQPGEPLVDAYYKMLTDPDEQVRIQAAKDWMAWEDAHVSMGSTYSPKEYDPGWRQVFATLVTHYWANDCFLPPDAIFDGMPELHGIPGVLIQGKLDVSGPAAIAWELHKAWPGSRFILVDDEGHGGAKMTDAMMAAVAEFAEVGRD